MPFEAYKSRVKIVRDEEVVKKWIDDQSWKTDYICLNLPEPLRLNTREAVEKHFRETHKENIIKPVESHTLSGTAARSLGDNELARTVRSIWEQQRRFPLQIATVLSQRFASRGLQFFKVNKTLTHVSIARPHFLDMAATPVSDGVKRIVDYIKGNLKCNRRKLVEALAPSPAPAPIPIPAAGEQAGAALAVEAGPTPEQTAIVSDLHWLIHQGHVIEFANGFLETAKRPLPKPSRPEPKPKVEKAGEVAAVEIAPLAEAAPMAEPTATESATPAEPEQAPPSDVEIRSPAHSETESPPVAEAEAPAQSEPEAPALPSAAAAESPS
jgi:hypothetical protein